MRKILIVDDEASIRMLYREEFQDEGYEVIEAEDGHKLTESIEKDEPDVIVLDIKMAAYDGLEIEP